MKRLIDVDKLKDTLNLMCPLVEGKENPNLFVSYKSVIDEIDNAEIIEPRTGRWEKRIVEDENPFFRKRFYCSACGDWTTYGEPKFCPNCGARMFAKDINVPNKKGAEDD